ncbi:hypothetical protein LINPERHAP2_LOCUS32967 [Linum perenne]
MIVNTLDRCFPFSFMSRKLPHLWAKKGSILVSDVGFGFYIVRFETVADYERAMFGGPWMINDHYVVIQEWRPYFRPEETILTTLRVWVRLPGLPFEYFDNSILKIIGDRIGRTVRIDHTTLEGSRGNFARICVEVDLSKPLLSKYRLRRRVRRIEYEGLHVICFNCGCYGHKDEACKKEPETDIVENQTTLFVNPAFQGSEELELRPEVEEDFGPWMQVKRNRRKTRPGTLPESTPPTAQPSAPSSSAAPADLHGKGNSFSVLGDKESEEGLVEDLMVKDSEPLKTVCEEDLREENQIINKENVAPFVTDVNSSLIPTPRPVQEVNVGLDSDPCSPFLDGSLPKPMSSNVTFPFVSSEGKVEAKVKAHLGPLACNITAPVVAPDENNKVPAPCLPNPFDSSLLNGGSKADLQSAPTSNRGFLPTKNSKISKNKKRDSVSSLGLKLRDESQRNVAKGSSSAMEEV